MSEEKPTSIMDLFHVTHIRWSKDHPAVGEYILDFYARIEDIRKIISITDLKNNEELTIKRVRVIISGGDGE